jgi:poly(3-hydroxybutyrate) depolymerase
LGNLYIGACQYDGAGFALKTVLKDENLTPGVMIESNLLAFDQVPYIVNYKLSSLSDVGYIYVPSACLPSSKGVNTGPSCHLHISFHGCKQGLQYIGNQYAAHTGFNSWAEANNIIVLYPYAKPSSSIPYNPNG